MSMDGYTSVSFGFLQLEVDSNGNVHYIVNSHGNRTHVSPEYVGSRVLAALQETAVQRLSGPVHKAVMSVPAEFDDRQRNATRKAASLAGMCVYECMVSYLTWLYGMLDLYGCVSLQEQQEQVVSVSSPAHSGCYIGRL